MKDRQQAMGYLSGLIRQGYEARTLFLNVMLEQDDWIGALSKPESFKAAAMLDQAQQVVLMYTSHPEWNTPEVLVQINKTLDNNTFQSINKPLGGLEQLRHNALTLIAKNLSR